VVKMHLSAADTRPVDAATASTRVEAAP